MAAPDTVQIQQSRLNLEATRELRRRLVQGLRGVDNAAAWTQANDTLLLEMVGYLSIGSLATLIREFLEAIVQDPTGPPHGWRQVKEAIITSFLDEDEREYLRSKVDDIVQNPYEDSREYGRRYKEATVPMKPLSCSCHSLWKGSPGSSHKGCGIRRCAPKYSCSDQA